MKTKFWVLIPLAFILAFITSCSSDAPLLQGHIDVKSPVEVAIVFDNEGDQYLTEILTDANGNFTYDTQLPAKGVDVLVYVDGIAYGAYIQTGKTTIMDITNSQVQFSGDNVDKSTFYNEYQRAFYPMEYKPDPDMPYIYEDYLNKLNTGRDRALAAADKLDKEDREWAYRLTSAYYDKIKITLMGMDEYEGTDWSEEINALIAKVDPNSDEARLSGMLDFWYNKSDIRISTRKIHDLLTYYKEQFAAIDSVLTNEGNKKSLYYTLGSMFMMFSPSDAEIEEFYAAVAPQLDKAPNVKQRLEEIREMMKVKVVDGDAVPCDPILIAPDDSRINLSDILAKGKVVYIDIWATWCKPCCAEIPHLEKLVERFKGNDEVIFVSISTDDKKAAWLRKVEIDNPSWPQYIFDGPSGDDFMSEMSINGIPRFLLIGRDGRFISTDAKRPSDKEIDSIILDAINGK